MRSAGWLGHDAACRGSAPGYRSVILVPISVPQELWAERCSVEHQEDHMAFPRVGAPRPAMAEDYGQLVMCSVSRSITPDVRRAVKDLTESPLLRKDVVPIVVTELPFLSPLRKVIGEAAYPLSLGSVGGGGVILLVLSILTVVFAAHCAFLLR
jgi:hypothetical protein